MGADRSLTNGAWLFVTAVVVLLVGAPLSAKFETTKITVTDVALGTSVDITDSSVLKDFNVWSGPGTYLNGVEGTQGFIIDWPAGVVDDRPSGLRRYDVAFYVRGRSSPEEEVVYVVSYERDESSGQGFVYLPGRSDERWGRNVRSIVRHGLEGHWFHATGAWQRAVERVLPVR